MTLFCVMVHFEKLLILYPLCSVPSVYSVVLADNNNHGIHGKHGEDTE